MATVSLSGKLIDEYGAVIVGATVELWEIGAGAATASTTTNGSGIWSFADQDGTKAWRVIQSGTGTQKREVYGGTKTQVAELQVKDRLVLPDGSVLTNTEGAGEVVQVSDKITATAAQTAFTIKVATVTKNASGVKAVFCNGVFVDPALYTHVAGENHIDFLAGQTADDEFRILFVEA